MKHLLFSTAVLIFAVNALAVPSLQDLIEAQETQEISPVQYNGNSIFFSLETASALCFSLGYSRLVDVKSETCQEGEILLSLGFPSLHAPYIKPAQKAAKCRPSYAQQRIAKLLCAK